MVTSGSTTRELVRGAVRLHILHHAAEFAVHGAWLTDELAKHGYDISAGTLYPLLHRMEHEGLIRAERRVVAGKTRRSYRITPAGDQSLKHGRRVLRELAAEVLGPTSEQDRPLTPASQSSARPDM